MRRVFPVLLLAALASLIGAAAFGAAGVTVVNHLESRRTFCTACHLPNGTPLHERKLRLALQQPGLDLVGVHFRKADGGQFTCADCHRGAGWRGRSRVLWASASDTLRYYLASYREPTRLPRPMGNRTCTGCHRDVTRAGNHNRFHGLTAHLDQTTIRCTDCHVAHARWSQPSREAAYLRHTAREVCGRCHKGDPPSALVQNVLDAYQQALLQRMRGPAAR